MGKVAPDFSSIKPDDLPKAKALWEDLQADTCASAHYFAVKHWGSGHGTHYSKSLSVLVKLSHQGLVVRTGPKWQLAPNGYIPQKRLKKPEPARPDLSRVKPDDLPAVSAMWADITEGQSGSAYFFANRHYLLFQVRPWPCGHGTYYSKMLSSLQRWAAQELVSREGPIWRLYVPPPPPEPVPVLPSGGEQRAAYLSNADLDFAIHFTRKFVMDRVRVYGCRHLETELLSDLNERAWKAWRSYLPTCGKEWRYWLLDQLRYGFKDSLRKHNGTRNKGRMEFEGQFRTVSLTDMITDPEEGEPDDPGRHDCYFPDHNGGEAERLLSVLPDDERAVIEALIMDGLNRPEAAKRLGIPSQRVRKLELQGLARLRMAHCATT